MGKSKSIYNKRVNYYFNIIPKLVKTINLVGYVRLIIVSIIIVNAIYFLKNKYDYISLGIVLFATCLFFYVVNYHNKLKEKLNYITILKEINQKSIDRLDGKWTEFKDDGKEFIDKEHRFSYDLDIFGRGSLFQWINSAFTFIGKKTLANYLINPCDKIENIKQRQEAISELSKKRWWRQKLQAESMLLLKQNKDNEIDDLLNWGNKSNSIYLNNWVIFIIRLLPIITISAIVLSAFLKKISYKVPITFVVIQFLMLFLNFNNMSKEFGLIYKYGNTIKLYSKILEHFEKVNFKSDYTKNLKEKLKNDKGISAIKQIKNLDKIVEKTLYRKNSMFFPINIIMIWDYQCRIDLEKWKIKYGSSIGKWIDVIGEIESLSSLATIEYDYPNWKTPILTEESSVLEAKSVGHPLIINKQVCNDIEIKEPTRILLITGSNMSGKSTLLRTIGINLVLAYAGTPVSAEYMKCSVMNIQTCMRTSDNLEKGISSFYGELQRIKNIVKESEKDKQVFFLLDEIFKGTNSYDRHIGAKMLLKQLYNNNTMGLVSTHDLELGDLEDESNGNILNYHFQEKYENDNIYFDYKLRSGISTTRNALYLIKMAGIKLEE